MKIRTIKFLIPVLAIVLLTACKPSPQQAVAYNDRIIEEIGRLQAADNEIAEAIKAFDAARLEEKIKTLRLQAEHSGKTVSQMENFDGKADYKKAALAFFEFYRGVAENEYRQVAVLMKKKDGTDADIEEANRVLAESDKKRRAAVDRFSEVQHKFADTYRFTLEQRR